MTWLTDTFNDDQLNFVLPHCTYELVDLNIFNVLQTIDNIIPWSLICPIFG